MANLKKYDPKDIIITVGPHIVSGYADGTFVSVARQGDSFSSIAGADGEVARARSNDKRGTITLTLMQTSRTNAYLSGLVAVDEETGNGVVPVTVRNAKGETLHFSAEAWIRKPSDAGYGKEIESREWTIDCALLQYLEAGV